MGGANSGIIGAGSVVDLLPETRKKVYDHILWLRCHGAVQVSLREVAPGSGRHTIAVEGIPDRVTLACDSLAKVVGVSPRPFPKGKKPDEQGIRERMLWAQERLTPAEYEFAQAEKGKGQGTVRSKTA